MVKKLIGLAVLFVFVLLAAGGCGGGGAKQGEQASQAPAAKKKELLFATGGTAGTYYPLGGAMAQIWNEKVPGVHVTVQSTGASVENMRLLNNGQADLGLAMNNVADDAYNGRGEFKDKPVKNFKAVGVVYPEVVQAFVAADSNIKTIADLKGKKVAVGPTGSGTEYTTRKILEAYGVTYKDITPTYATFADAVDQFKDKHIDAAFNVLTAPAASIQDVATMRKIRFLEITGTEAAKIVEQIPFFSAYEIPANSYPGQDQPVKTLTLSANLYVRADLDDETVYNLCKVMYENKDDIAKNNATAKHLNLQRALSGVTTPVHPGAEKYYKEKGISKS